MRFYSNIRKLYAIIFFHSLIPAYVIERLFSRQRGLSVQEMVYLEILYAAVIVLLEIPSGALADRFGNKKLLLVGGAMAAVELAILLMAHSFWQFALAITLTAVGSSATSGARNALLYDSLAAAGEEGAFERILGRARALDFSAGILAALSGGLLAQWYPFELNYALSLASMLMAFIGILSLREPPQTGCFAQAKTGVFAIVRNALVFFRSNLGVLFVLVNAAAIATCMVYVDEYWQLYVDEAAIPLSLFGVIGVGMLAARIPGAMLCARLLLRFRPQTVLLAASAAVALSVAFAALVQSPLGIAGILLACFAAAAMEPVALGYLHHRADASARATIESVSSLIERALTAGLGLLFGTVATASGIFSGFWTLALFGGVAALAVGYARRRELRIARFRAAARKLVHCAAPPLPQNRCGDFEDRD